MEQRLTERTAAQCALLSPPLHGSVSGSSSYGDVVHFTCEQGYRLVGKSSLTCLSDGTWNGNSPTCTAVHCPLLSPPLHGSVSGSNSYGDVVHFTCDQGYRLVGKSSLTCLSDGTWSGRSATCADMPRYLGCYKDSFFGRRFPSDRLVSDEMTTDTCIEHCKRHGHGYAATQYSHECFCGSRDNFLKLGKRRPDSECHNPCSGRSTSDEFCGGWWRMSVYRTERAGAMTPLRRILTAGSQLQHLGCWGDTADRAVPTLEGTDPVLDGPYPSRTDPVRKCQNAAAKRGYTVFAVQNGGWCAASADALQTYVKYGPSDACRPDGKGGPWANEVYRIVTQPPSWSASSEWDSGHSAHLADINSRETADSAGAWAAATNNKDQWLMRDLGDVSVITGVITKGRNGIYDQYVTSYVISYGDENGDEKFYTNDGGQVIVFPGNHDRDTEVINNFRDYNGPITARFIKIHPRTWHGHISMRAKISRGKRNTYIHGYILHYVYVPWEPGACQRYLERLTSSTSPIPAWNNLSAYIVDIPSLDSFRSRLYLVCSPPAASPLVCLMSRQEYQQRRRGRTLEAVEAIPDRKWSSLDLFHQTTRLPASQFNYVISVKFERVLNVISMCVRSNVCLYVIKTCSECDANWRTLNRDGGRHRLPDTYDPPLQSRVSDVTSRKLQ
ncbi:hypothetical protein Bbelb_081330 [Branchiostoma belcheri]|nr:hypothetical protein Bbelb_081330 [Branchiostoma belcheri]